MPTSINDPLVQGALLPLLASLLLTGAVRFSLGAEWGKRLASLSIGIAFLIAVLLIQGYIFPPQASTHKLPYLFAAGLFAGAALDRWRPRPWLGWLVILGWPIMVLGWLNSTRLSRLGDAQWLEIGGYGLGFMVALAGLVLLRKKPLQALTVTLFGALGTGAISLIGASALLATLAFALAAACGGFALWNWPRVRYGYGFAAVLGAGAALGTIAVQALMFSDASGWALGGLLLLLGCDRLSTPLARRLDIQAPWLRALLDAGVALVITLLAVGLALLLSSSGEYYG